MSRPLAMGLSTADARARLQRHGPNTLPGNAPKPGPRILTDVLFEPMFLLLLVAAGLYFALGSLSEAAFLLGSVLVVIGLSWFQERRSQRALEALRDLSAPRAVVIRDGQRVRVPGAEVVRDDLLALAEGDRVPADAVLVDGVLSIDESLLTGESVPVDKAPVGQGGDAARGMLYASTLVVRGRGLARVRATGAQTAVGGIGRHLAETRAEPSPLQRESRRMVRVLGVLAIVVASAASGMSFALGGQDLVQSALTGIALAMSLIPGEIPMVLTVVLALGAWRLTRHRVLVRRVQAVEALGGITTLAVDKTGTLTLNSMEVAALSGAGMQWHAGDEGALAPPLHALIHSACLACPTHPHDPMELAIRAFAAGHLPAARRPPDGRMEREYGLSPGLLAMTRVHATDEPGMHVLAAKGAPEAIAELCRLAPAERAALQVQVETMAAAGLRVLGVARGTWRTSGAPPAWPASQREFAFDLLGLLGLADPPRPEVPAAVAACRAAGIQVLMLTGDHLATARAIAAQIGLPQGELLTGADIDRLDDAQLRRRLPGIAVCARLQPTQKLRLVRCLQADGGRVAMTGDGVNDAPALAAADVGIAMGGRGTDVAREAAALVVLDDSFGSIVEAVQAGRRIRRNLRGAMRFIFAVHVPVVALALGPIAWGWPALLYPMHIVLFEMLIDPACSLLFEAEPAPSQLMRQRPSDAQRSPFETPNLAEGLLQGAGIALLLLAAAWVLLLQQWAAAEVRTAIVLALLGAVGGLAWVEVGGPLGRRAGRRNRWLAWPAVALAALLGLVTVMPSLRTVLGFAPVSAGQLAGMAALAAALAILIVLLRAVRKRTSHEHRAGSVARP